MTKSACAHEADVTSAAQSGAWSVELRSHAAQCPACADVALIVGALVQERRLPLAGRGVADAGLVWWRAQLKSRPKTTARAMRPIAGIEILALVFAATAGALVLTGVWPQPVVWTPALSAEALSGLSGLCVLLVVGAGSVLIGLRVR